MFQCPSRPVTPQQNACDGSLCYSLESAKKNLPHPEPRWRGSTINYSIQILSELDLHRQVNNESIYDQLNGLRVPTINMISQNLIESQKQMPHLGRFPQETIIDMQEQIFQRPLQHPYIYRNIGAMSCETALYALKI